MTQAQIPGIIREEAKIRLPRHIATMAASPMSVPDLLTSFDGTDVGVFMCKHLCGVTDDDKHYVGQHSIARARVAC